MNKEEVIKNFSCAELAEMSREKFNIEAKQIRETHEPMAATLKIASLQCSMWSPEYKKSIEEYLAESKSRYSVNYNEL